MTDRATTFEALKESIAQAYPTMSPQLQRLSRYVIDKPHDLALGTVATVAKANEVQPSSLIRFANALGYSGFSRFVSMFANSCSISSSSDISGATPSILPPISFERSRKRLSSKLVSEISSSGSL